MDIFDRVRHLGGSNFHRPLSAETVAFEKGSWGLGSFGVAPKGPS